MKKELLSEEIAQMKYLFNYKKGVVLSEQVTEPTYMSSFSGTPVTITADKTKSQNQDLKTPQTFTSDELKSQNQDLKKQIELEREKVMSARKENFKTIVDDKKENIAEFIDKVKEFIDNEKEDIGTFANNIMNAGEDIVNSISDRIDQAKTKLGGKIEDISTKRQLRKREELVQKFGVFKQKGEELKQTGNLLTSDEKRKAKRALLILLLDIIAAFSFFTFAPALVPLTPSIMP